MIERLVGVPHHEICDGAPLHGHRFQTRIRGGAVGNRSCHTGGAQEAVGIGKAGRPVDTDKHTFNR